MSAGKVVLLVFGIIIVLVAIPLLLGGGTFLWVDIAHRDSEGFVTSNTIQIEKGSHAIATGPIDIDEVALKVLDWLGLATHFKVEGRSNDPSKQIFIGMAEESGLEAYLSDVDYDEMSFYDIGWLSFDKVTYTNHPGSSEPADPLSQTFWRVSEHGSGTQTMIWETEVGSHSIVLMNDDGSAGLDLSAVFGVKLSSIVGWIVGLLIGGIVVLLLGAFMIVSAVRRS